MTFLKDVFRFYINSSINVSLAVVSLVCLTYLNLDNAVNYEILCFVFFSTITGYNFVKYAGIAQLHHRSLTHRLKIIQVFSIVSFIAMLYFLAHLPRSVWGVLVLSVLFTLFYAVPLNVIKSRSNKRRTLRDIAGIKILIIGVVWSLTTVILPAIATGDFIVWDLAILSLQRLLWVVVLTIPFEIRDLPYDRISLGTIPQRMGVRRAKLLGYLLLLVQVLLVFMRDQYDQEIIVVDIVGVCIAGLFLWRATVSQSRYYASFWVEAAPIFWLASSLILY